MQTLDPIVGNWNFQEVRKDLANMNSDSITYRNVLITSLAIAIIGLVSVAFGSSLIYGAAVLSFIGLVIIHYYEYKINKVKDKLDGQGLTRSKLTEIGINEFKEGIKAARERDWNVDSAKTISNRISPFLDGFVASVSTFGNSENPINAGICITEGYSINDNIKIALLAEALVQKIPLYFASLQQQSSTSMKTNSFGIFQRYKIKQKIKESAFLSARFIKECLVIGDEATQDLLAINRQLKALSFKYYGRLDDSTTIETICPTFQLTRDDRNRIVIVMIANKVFSGAEGDMVEILDILDHDVETVIVVTGEGWKNGLKAGVNNWNEFMQRYTMTTKTTSIIRNMSKEQNIPFWA